MEKELTEKSMDNFPDVMVKIRGEMYSMNSRYIISIMPLPKYNRVPGAPSHVLGVIDFRGEAIPLLDMRSLFGIPTLQEEYTRFVQMLEDRKQDHIRWVEALERSMETGEKFALATDPHKCNLGRWYDSFTSDSNAINFHLRKIEEPHRKLHEAAVDYETCNQEHDACQREKCLKKVLEEVKKEYMPQILELLEQTKDVFKNAYAEMVLVISNEERQVGVVVDEVLAVEHLKKRKDSIVCQHSEYVAGIKQQEEGEGLILDLDDELLLADADQLKDLDL